MALHARKTAAYLMPPVLLDLLKTLRRSLTRRSAAWEYVPEGWAAAQARPGIKGWNVEAIPQVQRRHWSGFLEVLRGPLPLCVAPEHPPPTGLATEISSWVHAFHHNNLMTFSYALARASRGKDQVSLLDWGGGIGHYYELARALYPDLEIEYHCKDVPVAAEAGREFIPSGRFYNDDSCLGRRYDLVLASGSFHYSEHWQETLQGLGSATSGLLLVTQLPVVPAGPSFVMVQRPYGHGYQTEYLGWCLARQQFLEAARDSGLELVREFINGYQPEIHRAPAQAEYRGYLFRPAHRS